MLHERVEDPGPGATAASFRLGRHPAYAPIAGLALGSDEPDRDQFVAVERAECDGVGRLVRGQFLDGHIRAQHVAPERARLRERDRAEVELRHVHTGYEGAGAEQIRVLVQSRGVT